MDKIKARIQSLCPDETEKNAWEPKTATECWSEEHDVSWCGDCYACKQCARIFSPRYNSPITLAVVLRAIKTKHTLSLGDLTPLLLGYVKNPREKWEENPKSFVAPLWNLEHDNYDQQSEECKQFIGSLLNV